MGKFFKWLFIFSLCTLVIAAGIFFYASRNIDSLLSYLSDTIRQNVSSALGTEVNFESISARSFPQTTIEIIGVSLKESTNYPEFTAAKIEAELSLRDVLRGNISVTGIKVSDFFLDMRSRQKPQPRTETTAAANQQETRSGKKVNVEIKRIDLLSGKIKYLTHENKEETINLFRLGGDISGIAGGLETLSVSNLIAEANAKLSGADLPIEVQVANLSSRANQIQFDKAKVMFLNSIISLDGGYDIEKGSFKSSISLQDIKALDYYNFFSGGDAQTISGGKVNNLFNVSLSGTTDLYYSDNTITIEPAQIKLRPQPLTNDLVLGGVASFSLKEKEIQKLDLKLEIPHLKLIDLNAEVPSLSFSPQETLSGDIRLSLDSVKNMRIKNEGLIKVSTSFSPEPLEISLDLSLPEFSGPLHIRGKRLNLAAISRLSPLLSSYDISSGEADGNIGLSIKSGSFEPTQASLKLSNLSLKIFDAALETLSAQIDMQPVAGGAGAFRINDLSGLYNSLPLKGSVTVILDQFLRLRDLDLKLAQTQIAGGARIELKQPYAGIVGAKIKGGSLNDLAKTFAGITDGALEGTLVSAEGEIESRAFIDGAQSFSGDANINIADAVFKGVNIGKTVIEKLEALPLIGNIPTRDLTPELRQSLTESDTYFKSIKGTFSLDRGIYDLTDINVVSDIFRAMGQGKILADKSLNIDLLVAVSPVISELIARRVREMNLLVNRHGEIEVPVKLSGTISNPRALPDTGSLAARAARRTAEGAIGSILERALEKHQRNPAAENTR